MESYQGIPIVTAANVFSVLEELGIRPWGKTGKILSLKEYEALDLTPGQRKVVEKFAPKTRVIEYIKQGSGWFQVLGHCWSAVFTMLPNRLVPVVGQYMHGADRVIIGLPAGFVDEGNLDIYAFLRCAIREVKEETGLSLAGVVPLASESIPIEPRGIARYYMPCLGYVKENDILAPQSLDETEELTRLLMPISEWLTLLDQHSGSIAASSSDTTYRALRYLKRYHGIDI